MSRKSPDPVESHGEVDRSIGYSLVAGIARNSVESASIIFDAFRSEIDDDDDAF